jgi:hypothetical protein
MTLQDIHIDTLDFDKNICKLIEKVDQYSTGMLMDWLDRLARLKWSFTWIFESKRPLHVDKRITSIQNMIIYCISSLEIVVLIS